MQFSKCGRETRNPGGLGGTQDTGVIEWGIRMKQEMKRREGENISSTRISFYLLHPGEF